MPLMNAAKVKEDKEYQNTPEGRYVANCYQVIDLGTQAKKTMDGIKPTQQILFGFEMFGLDANGDPTLVMADGRPYYGRTILTLSLHAKSKLRPFLGAWRGKPVKDEEVPGAAELIKSFLTQTAEIVVSHRPYKDNNGNDRVAEEFSSISPAHPKTTRPRMVNDPIFFDIGNWDGAAFDKLPQWIKTKIEQSAEFKEKDSFTSNLLPPQASTAGMRPSNRNYPPLPDDFEDDLPPF